VGPVGVSVGGAATVSVVVGLVSVVGTVSLSEVGDVDGEAGVSVGGSVLGLCCDVSMGGSVSPGLSLSGTGVVVAGSGVTVGRSDMSPSLTEDRSGGGWWEVEETESFSFLSLSSSSSSE
jgi:hypothetical protein